jgi:hypothetical protein
MERYRTARNIAIVAIIAAAVYFIPGGGQAASTFEAILMVGFGFGFAYLGLRLYREHRVTLHSLGDRHRAILYGTFALAAFVVTGYSRMVHHSRTLIGVLWFVLLLIVLYGAIVVYRHSRSY